jgi:hypothetical protein
VGVEVVHHQHDLLRLGVVDVQTNSLMQWAKSMRVRRSLTVTCRQSRPPALGEHENRLHTPPLTTYS